MIWDELSTTFRLSLKLTVWGCQTYEALAWQNARKGSAPSGDVRVGPHIRSSKLQISKLHVQNASRSQRGFLASLYLPSSTAHSAGPSTNQFDFGAQVSDLLQMLGRFLPLPKNTPKTSQNRKSNCPWASAWVTFWDPSFLKIHEMAEPLQLQHI